MNLKAKITLLIASASLTGCIGESLCGEYGEIPQLDRNENGISDYRFQVIGDSILNYHDITCKSVGHRLGLELDEPVLNKPVIGAKVHEIHKQYSPPAKGEPDYEYIIANGGLNDLIADEKVGAPEETACNCNGAANHDACLLEVEDITQRMSDLIDTIHSTSDATIALMAYYPAEATNSFIGECFPYVEQLNDSYRQLADNDSKVQVIETYGAGHPIIQKVNQFGRDNYHPTTVGSEQMAAQIEFQLGL